jgi:hypothetical protein
MHALECKPVVAAVPRVPILNIPVVAVNKFKFPHETKFIFGILNSLGHSYFYNQINIHIGIKNIHIGRKNPMTTSVLILSAIRTTAIY